MRRAEDASLSPSKLKLLPFSGPRGTGWLQPPHQRQRLNRRQELPVGMLLSAEDQGCHFWRESIELGSKTISLLELQPAHHAAVDQQAFQRWRRRSALHPPAVHLAVFSAGG